MHNLIWLIPALLIAGLIISLLIVPVRLHIDTSKSRSLAGWPGLLWLEIKMNEEKDVGVIFWIIFIRYSFYPLRKMDSKTETEEKRSHQKKSFKMPKWNRTMLLLRTFWQFIKKSKLKKLYLDVDTNDAVTNSLLFPVFAVINSKPDIDLNVNYTGRFSLVLDVHNNLLTLIIIFLKNLRKR